MRTAGCVRDRRVSRCCHQCLVRSAGRVHYLAPFWRALPRALQEVTARLPRLNTLELAAQQLARQEADFRLLVEAGSMFIAPSPIMRRLAEQAGVAPDRIVDLPYGVPSEFVGAAREKLPSLTLRVGFLRTAGGGERRRRAVAGGHLAAAEPSNRAESVRHGAAGGGRVSSPARRDGRPGLTDPFPRHHRPEPVAGDSSPPGRHRAAEPLA